MMKNIFVTMENFRCFAGLHNVKLAPLTLLVGENSAGKTSFLSVVSTLLNKNKFPLKNDFNSQPYELGDLKNIAFFDVKKDKHEDFFKIGYLVKDKSNEIKFSATYFHDNYQSNASSFDVKTEKGAFDVNIDNNFITNGTFTLKLKDSPKEFTFKFEGQINNAFGPGIQGCIPAIMSSIEKKDVKEREKVLSFVLGTIFEIANGAVLSTKDVSSIAPIRTKPKRSYDKVVDEYDSEGNHIPLKIANFVRAIKNEKSVNSFNEKLNKFGKESGLFDKIDILHHQRGNSFEIIVCNDGQEQNIVDVGYGVNQVLPIITQCLLEHENQVFVLQQPEVHLHPRAQAALGSFFAKHTTREGLSFIIETHSDYLIDRIRSEISLNKISKDMVKILFFEKIKGRTKIHDLNFDECGNILNAPSSYRRFFLEEELNILGG